MRAFNYITPKNEPRVGIEIEGRRYNYTIIWQLFKDIKNIHSAPDLNFLQVAVEMGYFSASALMTIFETVSDIRPLHDLIINDDFRLEVPITRPQKILCLGRNYRAHAEEWDAGLPEQPMFFSKLPSALLPHEGEIKIAPDIGRVDHEIELAVVIGKTCSGVTENKAMEYVAGYTIANDVTARDLQLEEMKNGLPWTLSKGFDTFCPMGPYLVPADAVDDPHQLDLELKVNGEVKQHANTRDMVFKVPKLVSYISRYISLQPGDILCTGTPAGTLPIKPGDALEASIQGLGVLRNSVVSA